MVAVFARDGYALTGCIPLVGIALSGGVAMRVSMSGGCLSHCNILKVTLNVLGLLPKVLCPVDMPLEFEPGLADPELPFTKCFGPALCKVHFPLEQEGGNLGSLIIGSTNITVYSGLMIGVGEWPQSRRAILGGCEEEFGVVVGAVLQHLLGGLLEGGHTLGNELLLLDAFSIVSLVLVFVPSPS